MTSVEVDRDEEPRVVVTARLRLVPAGLGDLQVMAALLGDERVWRHFPSGRHTSVERTRDFLALCERQWQRDGLEYWAVRLHQPLMSVDAGQFMGVGGCATSPETTS